MDVKTAAIQVLQQAGTAPHAKDLAEQIMAAAKKWKLKNNIQAPVVQ